MENLQTSAKEDWRNANKNANAFANWLIHFDGWFLIGWNVFLTCEKVVSQLWSILSENLSKYEVKLFLLLSFLPIMKLDTRGAWRLLRTSYKEDTRMGHIQPERLPKSKMASSDNRFTFEIVHALRFGDELNEELCCRFIFFNNH